MRSLLRRSWLALLVFLIAGAVGYWTSPTTREDENTLLSYLEPGEALLHGVPAAGIQYHLPLASLQAAVLFGDSQRPGERILFAVTAALLALLCACLGAPLAAIVAFPFWRWQCGAWTYPQSGLAPLLLLVAAVLALRAGRRSPAMTAWAAFAIGAALFFRSTLVLLPPLLVLLEGFAAWRSRSSPCWRDLAILLLAPYLFLLPWIFMNAELSHRFIPLEAGEADANVATGALGLVGTVEGDWRALSPELARQPRGYSLLAWAISEVARHPLRYGGAVSKRIIRVFLWTPALWLLALCGLWYRRESPGARSLTVLITYLLFVHCLMSVQANYFTPLKALLAVAAALLVIPPWPRGALGAGAALAAASLILSVEYAWAAWRVMEYPAFSRASGALERALRGDPRNAWLLHQKGLAEFRAGEFGEAASTLDAAAAEAPFDANRLEAAWAHSYAGDSAALMAWTPTQPSPVLSRRAAVLKAYRAIAAGRRREARSFLQEAVLADEASSFARGDSASESSATAALRRAARAGFGEEALRLVADAPPSAHLAEFIDELALLDGGPAHRDEYYHAAALTAQDLGRYAQARGLLKSLLRRHPMNAEYWSDLGVCEFLSGDSAEAVTDLKRAASLGASDASTYVSLAVVERSRGDAAAAARACARAFASERAGSLQNLRDSCAGLDLPTLTPRDNSL